MVGLNCQIFTAEPIVNRIFNSFLTPLDIGFHLGFVLLFFSCRRLKRRSNRSHTHFGDKQVVNLVYQLSALVFLRGEQIFDIADVFLMNLKLGRLKNHLQIFLESIFISECIIIFNHPDIREHIFQVAEFLRNGAVFVKQPNAVQMLAQCHIIFVQDFNTLVKAVFFFIRFKNLIQFLLSFFFFLSIIHMINQVLSGFYLVDREQHFVVDNPVNSLFGFLLNMSLRFFDFFIIRKNLEQAMNIVQFADS